MVSTCQQAPGCWWDRGSQGSGISARQSTVASTHAQLSPDHWQANHQATKQGEREPVRGIPHSWAGGGQAKPSGCSMPRARPPELHQQHLEVGQQGREQVGQAQAQRQQAGKAGAGGRALACPGLELVPGRVHGRARPAQPQQQLPHHAVLGQHLPQARVVGVGRAPCWPGWRAGQLTREAGSAMQASSGLLP